MNVRTALISSSLLLAVLGWACEQQGPTSPTRSLTPSGALATSAQLEKKGGNKPDGSGTLTRIMREGAVEGKTQEPPCGTNVVQTTF